MSRSQVSDGLGYELLIGSKGSQIIPKGHRFTVNGPDAIFTTLSQWARFEILIGGFMKIGEEARAAARGATRN